MLASRPKRAPVAAVVVVVVGAAVPLGALQEPTRSPVTALQLLALGLVMAGGTQLWLVLLARRLLLSSCSNHGSFESDISVSVVVAFRHWLLLLGHQLWPKVWVTF
jgi:hypothetical protein